MVDSGGPHPNCGETTRRIRTVCRSKLVEKPRPIKHCPPQKTLGLVNLGVVLNSARAAVVPIGAGLGGRYLGGDAPGYELLRATRRVTDEDATHGSGKAHGRYASVLKQPPSWLPSERDLILINIHLTARSTSTGISGDPVCVLRRVVTSHHVGRDHDA